MVDISNAIFQMTLLLIITAVGYLATKLGYLDMYVKTKLTALLMNICLPCMIVASAGGLDASTLGIQVPLMFVLGFVEFFLWLLVAFLFTLVFRVKKQQRPLYLFMSLCTNTSFVGIPVASALYGNSAALLSSVFIMITSVLMFIIGIAILVGSKVDSSSDSAPENNESQTRESPVSQKHPKAVQIVKSVVSPMTIGGLLAIFLVFSNIHMPEIVQSSLDTIGALTPPLAMMLVGVIIANQKLGDVVREWRLYPYIILRQLCAPALLYVVLSHYISDPIVLGILVVMFAMPVGSMASMYCASYGHDEVLPAKGTILSTMASFVIIPVLVAFIATL